MDKKSPFENLSQETMKNKFYPDFHSTTILCVRRDGKVALAGDGQVSMGQTVMKHTAKKVRRMFHDQIITGFAGSAADAFTLFELFEKKVTAFNGNLSRTVVELAREWRTDRMLRKLEALLIVIETVGWKTDYRGGSFDKVVRSAIKKAGVELP